MYIPYSYYLSGVPNCYFPHEWPITLAMRGSNFLWKPTFILYPIQSSMSKTTHKNHVIQAMGNNLCLIRFEILDELSFLNLVLCQRVHFDNLLWTKTVKCLLFALSTTSFFQFCFSFFEGGEAVTVAFLKSLVLISNRISLKVQGHNQST
jgi:hypothetical protein